MSIRAAPEIRVVRRLIVPCHDCRFAMGYREGHWRRCSDRCAGAHKATYGASAVVLAMLTAVICRLIRSEAAAVTDFSDAQWIGGSDGSRPACAYRGKDLHQ